MGNRKDWEERLTEALAQQTSAEELYASALWSVEWVMREYDKNPNAELGRVLDALAGLTDYYEVHQRMTLFERWKAALTLPFVLTACLTGTGVALALWAAFRLWG